MHVSAFHPGNSKGIFWLGIGISLACLAGGAYGFFPLIFLIEDPALGAAIALLLFAGLVALITARLNRTGRTQTAKAFLIATTGGRLLVAVLLYCLIQGISAAIGFC